MAATPTLRLIVVGELEGLLEPCGCSRDVPGGVDRLVTAIRAARAEAQAAGIHSLLIAAGDMLFGRGVDVREQDVWGAELIAEVLERLQVDVIAPGVDDVSHPVQLAALAQRTAAAAWLGETLWNPLAQSAWSPSAVVRAGGGSSAFVLADAVGSFEELRERASLVVAIDRSAHGEVSTAADVVIRVGADAGSTPYSLPNPTTLLLEPGRRGESLLLADLQQLGSGPWHVVSESANGRAFKVERRFVDSQIASDPDTRSQLDKLFARQNAYNQKHPGPPAPSVMRAEGYVGSDTCAACHTRAFFWWQTSPHAHAFETLVKRGRQFDRDCIACHVTGYDRPGGATLADVEHFAGVGCESCHGPGSEHADNPRSPSASVRRGVPLAICRGCHDAEHHAGFRDELARPQLLMRDHGQGFAHR